jgi:geranylgeranyl pyrophosphate synthase
MAFRFDLVLFVETSGLVKMTIEMLYQYSGVELDEIIHFSTLADRLGLCFQMWDDLMNITSQRVTKPKTLSVVVWN